MSAGWGGDWGGGGAPAVPQAGVGVAQTWQDGWATNWGELAEPDAPTAGEAVGDALNLAIRLIVRTAMGMAPGTVRPANQVAPQGGSGDAFATVLIYGRRDVGYTKPLVSETNDDDAGAFAEVLVVHSEITASVQFFKSYKVDLTGQPQWATLGAERAMRLPLRIRLERVAALMRRMNIGLIGAGEARDLSALVNGTWESRGQVDLRFFIVSREADDAEIITSANAQGLYQPPGLPPRTV